MNFRSLRFRLTILYTSLITGILLLFGVLVYLLVSVQLFDTVDRTLIGTANEILGVLEMDASAGDVNMPSLPPLELTANIYIQLWDRHNRLVAGSPGLRDTDQPLDPPDMTAAEPVLRYINSGSARLRVLTVPLEVRNRPMGVLQIATNLWVVDRVLSLLVYILLAVAFFAIVLAWWVSWVSLGRTLSPLEDATQTADQISRADDLSRRIPYDGPPDDEIGLLIQAFNHSLERLEILFTSQQRFLADVSHELRTPLTVIKGNVDLVRKFGPDEDSLDSIRHEADRLTRLVGELLMLAQAETGRLSLNLAPLEVDSLLLEVFQEMRVLAGSKVHLKLLEIDEARVNGDRDRLKQVLINLISNAIQYTPQGGQVTVSMTLLPGAAPNKGEIQISVQDTGPGIPTEDLPFIFDRFYRGEKSRTRSKSTGFGLGLSIANWIVNHHGGGIEAESQVGKGTKFVVTLPLAA